MLDEAGRVLDANARALEILGRAGEDPKGILIEELLPALGAPSTAADGVKDTKLAGGIHALLSTLTAETEVELTTASQEKRVIACAATAFVSPGASRPLTALSIQDVTPIVELQHERDRLLKLAAVSTVLPAVLHELKAPLAAVQAMVTLLLEDTVEDQLQMDLHAIYSEIRRARLTLQGIGCMNESLRSARYEAIDHAIQETVRIMEPSATRAGVTIDCSSAALPLLPFEPAVVRALVFNFLNNAIAASPSGAVIAVDYGITSANELEIRVEDHGRGMSPETLAHCTELFYTTKPQGSGLGLALAHQAVDDAGGALELTSTLGKGTIVTVRVKIGRIEHPASTQELACHESTR